MLTWRDFFDDTKLLTLADAEVHYPNAKRHLIGSVFVSHAGSDARQLDLLLSDPLRERYGTHAVFQYSSRSPGEDAYKQIVRLALEYCRCSIVACSAASRNHQWVYAEVDWLLEHERELFVLRLDSSELDTIHPRLADTTRVPDQNVFFESNVDGLFQCLDQLGSDRYPAPS